MQVPYICDVDISGGNRPAQLSSAQQAMNQLNFITTGNNGVGWPVSCCRHECSGKPSIFVVIAWPPVTLRNKMSRCVSFSWLETGLEVVRFFLCFLPFETVSIIPREVKVDQKGWDLKFHTLSLAMEVSAVMISWKLANMIHQNESVSFDIVIGHKVVLHKATWHRLLE